jgi:TatD DNase family protein
MVYVDVHTHYDDPRYDQDRDEVLSRLPQAGLRYVINAGSDRQTSSLSLMLAEQYPFMYACCGIHPHEAITYRQDISEIEEMLTHEKCVAVGETGLDYYYENTQREIQMESFRKHLELAVRYRLPVIIHNREATKDCLEILQEYEPQGLTGVFHCFSGSTETAKIVINKGYYISVGGPVTFKNAKKIIDVVQYAPLDRLMTETDCPYLAPEPNRGKRNDSSNIPFVLQKIAELKNVSSETVAEAVLSNTKKLFQKIR